MLYLNRFFKLLTIFLILLSLNAIDLYSDEKIKDEKIKDKDVKIKDKDEKVKDEKIKDKIKDTIVISNTEKDAKSFYEKQSAMPETTAKVEKNISNLENIQLQIDKIKKIIKQNSENSNDIKISLLIIKDNVLLTNNERSQIINKLNKKQFESIKEQNNSITSSITNLDKFFDFLNTDKEIKSQELFDITLGIEKEINIIYRQFRAIDWILFGQ